MALNYQKLIFETEDSVLVEHMKTFNISEKMLDESLDQLVSYFKKQPHLPDLNKDDPRLRRILSMNKYSIETSKRKIENFITARSLYPEYFSNRDVLDHETRKYIGTFDFIIMPKLTPENYRIIIFKLTNSDVDLFDPVKISKISYMMGDFRIHYDTVYEDIYITDLSKVTINHGLKMNPLLMKKIIFINQECYSARIKSLHMINVQNYMQTLINLFKTLIKKKVADRIQIHTNMESLHTFIPKDCLPTEFGGIAGDMKDIKEKLINAMETKEWRQRLIDLGNEKSDESKRPEGSNTCLDFSGGSMDGSFRTLDID